MWTDEDLRAAFHVSGRPADPRRVEALMAAIRTRPPMRGAVKAVAAAAILTLALGASFPGSRAIAARVAPLLQRGVLSGQIGGMRVTVIQNQGTRPVVGPSRSTGGAGPMHHPRKMTIAKVQHLIPVWMGTPQRIFNVPGVKTESVGFLYRVRDVQPVTVIETANVRRAHGPWVLVADTTSGYRQ